MKAAIWVPVAMLAVGVTACVPKPEDALAGSPGPSEEAPGAKSPGPCDAQRVNRLIGRKLTSGTAEAAMNEAGAAIVRTAHKDGMITMDYNADRLNIFYDDANIIVRLSCG